MRVRMDLRWLLGALIMLLTFGCGGGGGGSPWAASVSLFVTDDLHSGYDGVWVNILKMELVSGSGSTVVFDDPAGQVVNVRALNVGGTARFLFAGEDNVSSGDYTGARITLKKDVVLFPTGSSTGQAREFAGLNNASQKIIEIAFGAPKRLGATAQRLVFDFKLSDWTDDGSKIQNARIEDGPTSGLDDPARHEEDDISGTLTGLAGASPNLTFTLQSRRGTTLAVKTNAQTAIFNSNGAPNPALANAKRVEVRGTYDPNQKAVIAASVKIEDPNGEDPHQVKGGSSAVNEAAGTFLVAIREARGFIPEAASIKVQTTASTRFRSHGGLVLTSGEFYAMLAAHPGMTVEVEGTVSQQGETVLTAKSAKFEDEDDFGEAEAKGAVTAFDTNAGTFTFTISEWEGFQSSMGAAIGVTTSGSTQFLDSNGATVSKSAFFASLSVGTVVEAKGAINGGVLASIRLKLEDVGSGEAEAKGSVLSIDAANFKFDISLTQWFGFSGSHGMTVHVDASAASNFRDLNGNSVSRDAFFAALHAGATTEVKGVFNPANATLSAVRARLED